MEKPGVDWDAVEPHFRANLRSLRNIGKEFGCTEGAIRKKAIEREWVRDLSAKIKAKAEALVRKKEVRTEVRKRRAECEKQQIEASAQVIADAVLNQRADVKRSRATVQKLWALVDAEIDNPDALAKLGELMAAPDKNGADLMRDMYAAAIGLPQQIKNAKLLADAIKIMIELERKVLRIDDPPFEDDARKAGAAGAAAVVAGVDVAMQALAARVQGNARG